MSDHGEGAGGPGHEPVPEPLPRLSIKVPSPKKLTGDGEDLKPEAFDRWYNSVQLYLRLHNVSRTLQDQETTGFSIQKDEPKKRHSRRQSYLEKTSRETY